MNRYMQSRLLGLVALGLGLVVGIAHGQGYPNKPIHFVVPAAAGGGTDFTARLIGSKLSEGWGQPVVVENRGSAASNIGTAYVAKSPPDGYTLLVSITSFSTNPALFSDLPYDTLKDFEPVSLLALVPLLLTVNPSVQATSVKELIALAKARPGVLNYANSGSGTTSHLAAELFKRMAGVDIVAITYKGGGPAVIDLISGQVQIYFSTIPAAIQHVNSGKLRALAVTSLKRVPEIPTIPTIDEAGLPGFDVVAWFGLFGPAGVPRPIITKLSDEVVKILNMPETRERLTVHGLIPTGSKPEELGKLLKTEVDKWAKLIKEAGIRAQ